MDIIRTLGVFLVYKKKGLIKMEMNELQTLRHSASHILAQAVKRLYPDTKLAIGPAIDDGFYYDFDTEHTFTPEDLEALEKEMKKIAKENLIIERFELPRAEALELMKDVPQGRLYLGKQYRKYVVTSCFSHYLSNMRLLHLEVCML